ncbi:MAG: glycosyltransferase family 2 protein [Deltaproteobacteria bacterium]|nr:glycosyltransferase family 2 protein [Deltaproteobacteria bacterium]
MDPVGPIKKISFVVPVYNEEENISPLVDEVLSTAGELGIPFEIIIVDDGSVDGTLPAIRARAAAAPEVKYISFLENHGQSAALYAGFQSATGDTIVTLDGDLQNDLSDLPAMLALYGEYDVVTGWRQNRRDTLSRKIGSWIGNTFRNRMTGESIRDTGCSLKVMRASMLKRIRMYRGLHRFLPTLMRMEGARVVEVRVNHRPRVRGVSKYSNLRRGIEGFHDVLAVRWMIRRNLAMPVREKNV